VVGVPGSESAPISWTRRRAINISSSVKTPKGSRLLRIVPVKRVGSTIKALKQPSYYHKTVCVAYLAVQ
jgi:hypothetical protein